MPELSDCDTTKNNANNKDKKSDNINNVFAVSATPAVAIIELDAQQNNSTTLSNGYESKDLDQRLHQLQQQQQNNKRRLSRNLDF